MVPRQPRGTEGRLWTSGVQRPAFRNRLSELLMVLRSSTSYYWTYCHCEASHWTVSHLSDVEDCTHLHHELTYSQIGYIVD